MESITDLLAGTVDTEEECEEELIEGKEVAEEKAPVEEEVKRKDLFSMSEDDDEALPPIHSYYTEPVDIEKIKRPRKTQSKADALLICKPDEDTDDDIITKMPPGRVEEDMTPLAEDLGTEGLGAEDLGAEGLQPEGEAEPQGRVYCHCRYGESGVMVECEACNEWYHDECIGLTEEETYNIEIFYCAPCASKDPSLETKYTKDPTLLREKIISDVKKEEKSEKVRKRNLSKAKIPRPVKAKTPKSIKSSVTRPPSLKKKTPIKTPKSKNKILNRALPNKKTFSFGNDSSDNSDDSEIEFKNKKSKKDKKDKVAFLNCGECGEAVPNRVALARHMKKHVEKEDQKHACDECPKVFHTAKALRDHQQMHSGIKPFSCMFCGESFYLMSQVTHHTNSKHLNVRHQCEHCSRSYSNRTGLLIHVKKNHSDEIQESD